MPALVNIINFLSLLIINPRCCLSNSEHSRSTLEYHLLRNKLSETQVRIPAQLCDSVQVTSLCLSFGTCKMVMIIVVLIGQYCVSLGLLICRHQDRINCVKILLGEMPVEEMGREPGEAGRAMGKDGGASLTTMQSEKAARVMEAAMAVRGVLCLLGMDLP